MDSATSPAVAASASWFIRSTPARRVSNILVPVSPSGTGKTLEGVGGVPVQFHVGNCAEHGLAQVGTLQRGEKRSHAESVMRVSKWAQV